jgi:hypothetical protein
MQGHGRLMVACLDEYLAPAGRLSVYCLNDKPPACLPPQLASFPARYFYAPKFKGRLRSPLHAYDAVLLHGMWLYPFVTAAEQCGKRFFFNFVRIHLQAGVAS